MKDKKTENDLAFRFLTTSIRITKTAHKAANVHVALSGSTSICEYVSNLIMLDKKRKSGK